MLSASQAQQLPRCSVLAMPLGPTRQATSLTRTTCIPTYVLQNTDRSCHLRWSAQGQSNRTKSVQHLVVYDCMHKLPHECTAGDIHDGQHDVMTLQGSIRVWQRLVGNARKHLARFLILSNAPHCLLQAVPRPAVHAGLRALNPRLDHVQAVHGRQPRRAPGYPSRQHLHRRLRNAALARSTSAYQKVLGYLILGERVAGQGCDGRVKPGSNVWFACRLKESSLTCSGLDKRRCDGATTFRRRVDFGGYKTQAFTSYDRSSLSTEGTPRAIASRTNVRKPFWATNPSQHSPMGSISHTETFP